MQILLNGETTTIEDGLTVQALLQQLELVGRRIAVEVNEENVPRSEHDSHQLAADDRVEIVHAIGGG